MNKVFNSHPQYTEVISLLEKKPRVAILTHANPDGDAMGSLLGFGLWLKWNGLKVKMIVPNAWPDMYSWMPHADECIDYQTEKKKGDKAIQEAEYIFCLDFNHISRSGEASEALAAASAPRILIDHHPSPGEGFEYMFSFPGISSTCQLLTSFILESPFRRKFNASIATCLYTGIMTDTGSFRHRGTDGNTHRMLAGLIDAGADNTAIHENIYDTSGFHRLRLTGFALHQKTEFLPELHSAFISLSLDELQRFDHQAGDTEGLVNLPLGIKGVRFSAFFMERKEDIKISFRSKGQVDVNRFAREFWNGGGHRNAAGGKWEDSLDNTILRFVQLLPEFCKTWP